MADSPAPPENGTPPQIGPTAHQMLLLMLDQSVGGQIGVMLNLKVEPSAVMNLLIEHLCRLISLVEPEQMRNAIIAEIRHNLPSVMNKHLDARMKSPGGIIRPGPGDRVQ